MGPSKKRTGKKGSRGNKHTSGATPWVRNIDLQLIGLSIAMIVAIAVLMQVSLPGSGIDAAVACSIFLLCQIGLLFLFPRAEEKEAKELSRSMSRAQSENALDEIAELLGLARSEQHEIEASIKQLVSSEAQHKQQLAQAKETAQQVFQQASFTPMNDLSAALRKAGSILQDQRALLDALGSISERGEPPTNVKQGLQTIQGIRPIVSLARETGDVLLSRDLLAEIFSQLLDRGAQKPTTRKKIRELATSWRSMIEKAQKEVPRLELECDRLQADLAEANSTVESLRRELDELQAKHQREISGFSERLTTASTEISRNSRAAETLRNEITRLEQELARQREEVANLTSLQTQELEWAEILTDELAWNLEAHTALVGVVAYLQFHWQQEPQDARSTWIDQTIRPVEAALERRHIERLEAHGARAFKLFGSSFYGVEGMSASTLEIARSVNFDESSFESFRRLARSKTSDAAANFVAQHLPEKLRSVVVELLR
jgi:hypothetical protein